jgi:hypothetical protein
MPPASSLNNVGLAALRTPEARASTYVEVNAMQTVAPSPNTVHGSCRWLQRIISPCTLIPAGEPGLLEISTRRGTNVYAVSELFDDHHCLAGYRLRKDEETAYDIDLEWGVGQWLCANGQRIVEFFLTTHR